MAGQAFSGILSLMGTRAIKQNEELILILIINDSLGEGETTTPSNKS